MSIFKFGEENNDLGHGEERFNNLKERAEKSWGDDDNCSFESLAKFASSKDNYEKMHIPKEIQDILDYYSEDEKKAID